MNFVKLIILKCIYKIPKIGKKFIYKLAEVDGGSAKSLILREYVIKNHNVNVGLYSYGSCMKVGFNNGGKVIIGRYCSFAANIKYFGANHPIDFVSSSPFFYNKSYGFKVNDVPRSILNIGNDVWIGYGVIITAGCTNIGNGAIIGAGSVVTSDVPAYTIVAGNPAKIIRKRFSEETINLLEKSKWYEKDPEELINYYSLMSNPSFFAKTIIDSII